MTGRVAEAPEIVVERVGALGVVRLNRPGALNALTLGMVRNVRSALEAYDRDPSIAAILLEGEGERGLCAGGDIRAIHASGLADDGLAEQFWREEFQLVARIAAFAKPFVSFMDGIVMGGGVGVSAHAGHRVVTERTRLAMPEVGIGFFPDVGSTWLLTRARHMGGVYLAMTGAPVGAADAVQIGLADHPVAGADLPSIRDALAALSPNASASNVNELLGGFATEPQPGVVERNRGAIDDAFRHSTVEAVVAALACDGSEFAARTAATLAALCPTSLKVTLEILTRARGATSLQECLVREFHVARRMFRRHDFYEGVRAAVIDKDRRPRWSPAALAEVGADTVAALLAPDPLNPLELPA